VVVIQELRHPSPSPYRFFSAMVLLVAWGIYWAIGGQRR